MSAQTKAAQVTDEAVQGYDFVHILIPTSVEVDLDAAATFEQGCPSEVGHIQPLAGSGAHCDLLLIAEVYMGW